MGEGVFLQFAIWRIGKMKKLSNILKHSLGLMLPTGLSNNQILDKKI